MNREILFRGKSIDNGEWVMSNFVCAGEDVAMVAFYKVLRNTIGQFTGLCNDNGNKIFEDDIVVFDEAEDLDMERAVVVFDDGKFKLKYCNYGYMDDLDGVTAKRQIIIGNIHDNPEMCEVKQ